MKCEVQVAGLSCAPVIDHPVALRDPDHWNSAIVATRKMLFPDLSDQLAAAAVLAARAMNQAGPDFLEQGKTARFLISVFE